MCHGAAPGPIGKMVMLVLELILLCHKMLKAALDKGLRMVMLEHQNRINPAVYAGWAYFYDTVVLKPCPYKQMACVASDGTA